MRLLTKIITLGLIATCSLVVAGAVQAAPPLTTAQIDAVRNNCTTAQVELQRVRDSDLTARTVRGRSYNDLSVLIKALNSRVALSGVNAPDLIAVPPSLDRAYRDFYNHYNSYATSMKEALSSNCQHNPEQFYTLFVQLENQRQAIEQDIVIMQQLIDEYQKGVIALKAQLQQSTTTEGAER